MLLHILLTIKEVSHAAIWLENVGLTRVFALIILTAVLKNSDAALVSVDSMESSITLNGTLSFINCPAIPTESDLKCGGVVVGVLRRRVINRIESVSYSSVQRF